MKTIIKTISMMLKCVLLAVAVASCGGTKPNGEQLLRKGMEETREGNLPSAYHLLRRAMDAFVETKDSTRIFQARTYFAIVCALIDRDAEGYDVLKQTQYQHIREKGNYSSQYYYRAKAYYAFTIDKDYKTAAACLDSLLVIDRTDFPDDKLWLRMDLSNLAEMYFMTGREAKARNIIMELEDKACEGDAYLAQTYYVHAKMLMAAGKADSAATYAEKCLHYSERFKVFDNAADAIRIMMNRDSMNNDLAAYIRHRDRYDSLNATTRNNETEHKIAVMQERYKFEMMQNEAKKRHATRMTMLGGLAFGAIALSIISMLLYKQNKLKLKTETAERERLDTEVEYKRLENELLELKMEKTRAELEKTKGQNAEAIRKIAAANERKDHGTRLQLLEATLETEHAEFIKQLEANYPQLTRNDILILGLMRMKLTSQEIAATLGISAESLTKARYRLRKKMSISSMEELTDIANNSSIKS